MDTLQFRSYEMLKRVRTLGERLRPSFAPDSKAVARFDKNDTFITEIERVAGIQTSQGQDFHGGTLSKDEDMAVLLDLYRAIVKTGKVVFQDAPANLEKMRMPRAGKEQQLIIDAKTLKTLVEPFAADFIAEEMPSDFLTKFQTAIDNFDAEISMQGEAELTRSGATAALIPILREAVKNVRDLDAPIENKFAGDPQILTEWDKASHILRGKVDPTRAPAAAK